jgi:hypothetical protein
VKRRLTPAEANHLRRLLGWVRCEVWQSPEEFEATLREIAPACGMPDADAEKRLRETYEKAAKVPQYVRAALKALGKAVAEDSDEIIDGEVGARVPARMGQLQPRRRIT